MSAEWIDTRETADAGAYLTSNLQVNPQTKTRLIHFRPYWNPNCFCVFATVKTKYNYLCFWESKSLFNLSLSAGCRIVCDICRRVGIPGFATSNPPSATTDTERVLAVLRRQFVIPAISVSFMFQEKKKETVL